MSVISVLIFSSLVVISEFSLITIVGVIGFNLSAWFLFEALDELIHSNR